VPVFVSTDFSRCENHQARKPTNHTNHHTNTKTTEFTKTTMTTQAAQTKVLTKTTVSLAAMMFLQFMLVAVWFMQLAAYLANAEVGGVLKSVILGSMAIGSMASPIVCGLAGRYLAAQKVLAIANAATAALLLGAALFHGTPLLVGLCILLAMIAYMPTWALTSSIAMTHSDPKNFPIIRTFGTIGWVASGLFSVVALYVFDAKIDGTVIPLFCGAAIGIVAALQNLTLPDTPPSNDGSKFSVSKVLGLEAFSLLRDRNFLVFMIGSMLTAIAFALYQPYSSQFLGARGFANITVALNWGQFAEMFFMAATTVVLAKFGVKKALIFGLLAMTVRYLAFYLGDVNDMATLYYAGILLHGFIFGWFFIGGQVYTTQKAPKELVAQAQGMFAFLVWGVATLVGVFIYGTLIEKVTKPVTAGFSVVADGAAAANVAVATTAVTNWSALFLGTAIFSAVILVFFALFFKEEKQQGA